MNDWTRNWARTQYLDDYAWVIPGSMLNASLPEDLIQKIREVAASKGITPSDVIDQLFDSLKS